jgi:hypothetical protein
LQQEGLTKPQIGTGESQVKINGESEVGETVKNNNCNILEE